VSGQWGEAHTTFVRPDRHDETHHYGTLSITRQRIESITSTTQQLP